MIVLVVLATSVAMLGIALATGTLSAGRLARAIGVALETIGAVTIFTVANVAIGVTLILALRLTTPFYPTLYEIADLSLLGLSTLQALIYQSWRLSRK